jgi:AcrR family transcriptional regulator
MTNSERDTVSRLIATAFAEAERRGWRGLTIPVLAKKAGLSVAEAYKIAPDMPSLLDVYSERIDAAVAEEFASGETGEAADAEWRERLFDAFMQRFDAMLKDRDALRVIVIDERRDVVGLPRAALRSRRSMARMLDAAGLGDDALVSRAAAIALVPLYARIFQVWLKDEPDQAKTMAALDKALRRIERWLERTRSAARRVRPEFEDESPPPDAAAPASDTKH